jgi:hypothetical protein
MIYIVLGMHKSGTTLLARALHESGIVMGQEFPKDADYAKVKYEAKWAQNISDDILGMSRKRLSLDVTSNALPADGVSESALLAIRENAGRLCSLYDDWGFKDPRAALTYPYWKDSLPPHKVIVIYRDPIEVWRRYARVDHKWWSRTAFRVWCDYNKCILESVDTGGNADVLVLKFEDVLSTQDEWARLEKFVGRELTDVRDPGQSKFSVAKGRRNGLKYRFLQKMAGAEVWAVYQQLESLHDG